MKDVFYPSSVAVVGVSSNPDNLGRNIMLNLIDFGFDAVVISGVVPFIAPEFGLNEWWVGAVVSAPSFAAWASRRSTLPTAATRAAITAIIPCAPLRPTCTRR